MEESTETIKELRDHGKALETQVTRLQKEMREAVADADDQERLKDDCERKIKSLSGNSNTRNNGNSRNNNNNRKGKNGAPIPPQLHKQYQDTFVPLFGYRSIKLKTSPNRFCGVDGASFGSAGILFFQEFYFSKNFIFVRHPPAPLYSLSGVCPRRASVSLRS